ncbi:hypothetical protein EHW99_1399 [Erwinia amylovora]|uniref:Uncharacterized protein n=2 Tax=Erwinia amylovora TaxID=552 RepID=A0A831A3C2_ERWAM|nr:hypothetical protein EaACW_2202 [Erwinia amylovora ACW56400]QJQ54104.1 hypothetical protein EHX00_1399 [Erwinia amylovora]CBA21235.1 hypothetical protein predicted by Glimmer/Critica [Erwinia amylovora CFBP1430]CCO79046.1 hypothetical protein BN432_2257 [Erwinia amylovora Ea356]CCO82850.1 hypothetical protein BN433_2288 [Erwinia amylovora Ea266]CCO86623.1 hypothetical protein BN434_2243 [Erwinia amylovora CFBP 2585]CCO90412.1 hypothetical protein BN435_2250 [Erwinia amylovora 01SFR-BO]CCO
MLPTNAETYILMAFAPHFPGSPALSHFCIKIFCVQHDKSKRKMHEIME